MRPRGSLAGVLAAGLVLLLAAACRPPGRAAPSEQDLNPKELEPGIVRAVDLLRIPGLQPMQRLGSEEAADFDQPTLIGPCGATIAQPRAINRLVAVFLGETAALTEAIVEVDESEAEELVSNIRGDLRPDCEPQTSVGQDGLPQVYTQGPPVEVGDLADGGVATTATLEFSDQTLHLGTILMRRGGLLIQGLLTSEEPVSSRTVADLARLLESASQNLEE